MPASIARNPLLAIQTPLTAFCNALQPEAWIAREALSEIGKLRLLCLSLQAELPLDALLGQSDAVQTLARRTRMSAASVSAAVWNPDAHALQSGTRLVVKRAPASSH